MTQSRVGRPSKLTQEVIDFAEEQFGFGRYTGYTSVALQFDVNLSTVRGWVSRGLRLRAERLDTPRVFSEHEELCLKLAEKTFVPREMLKKATDVIKRLLEKPEENWASALKAAMWVIERNDMQNIALLEYFSGEEDEEGKRSFGKTTSFPQVPPQSAPRV